jgi:hypothetical protein
MLKNLFLIILILLSNISFSKKSNAPINRLSISIAADEPIYLFRNKKINSTYAVILIFQDSKRFMYGKFDENHKFLGKREGHYTIISNQESPVDSIIFKEDDKEDPEHIMIGEIEKIPSGYIGNTKSIYSAIRILSGFLFSVNEDYSSNYFKLNEIKNLENTIELNKSTKLAFTCKAPNGWQRTIYLDLPNQKFSLTMFDEKENVKARAVGNYTISKNQDFKYDNIVFKMDEIDDQEHKMEGEIEKIPISSKSNPRFIYSALKIISGFDFLI